MKAFILAGGEGKRLHPYTKIFPKPLLPINDEPILSLILKHLKKYEIDEVILATNYKAPLLKIYFGDGSEFGIKINYSKEEKILGTAGPLKLVEDQLKEDFIVMNGDILTDLNINKLIKFHKTESPDITVVCKKEEVLLNYGMIESNGENIIDWKEKPTLNVEISTGIYILNPSVIKHIDKDEMIDMPDLVKRIIKSNGKVLKFMYEGKWIDIGRIDTYQKAQS